MYTVEAFDAPDLGNASFLVADTERGIGLVVDPLRDIDRYLHRASALNIKLTHALDTHLHNDFVSGRRELAAETGTNIDEVGPGGELAFGDVTVRAIHTPGHTPDHKSYLLTEAGRPRLRRGPHPWQLQRRTWGFGQRVGRLAGGARSADRARGWHGKAAP